MATSAFESHPYEQCNNRHLAILEVVEEGGCLRSVRGALQGLLAAMRLLPRTSATMPGAVQQQQSLPEGQQANWKRLTTCYSYLDTLLRLVH